MDDVQPTLEASGFTNVSVVCKDESREFIKDWLPGSGCENFVVSANITATKPLSATSTARRASVCERQWSWWDWLRCKADDAVGEVMGSAHKAPFPATPKFAATADPSSSMHRRAETKAVAVEEVKEEDEECCNAGQ